MLCRLARQTCTSRFAFSIGVGNRGYAMSQKELLKHQERLRIEEEEKREKIMKEQGKKTAKIEHCTFHDLVVSAELK